jgi:hypothetical protein
MQRTHLSDGEALCRYCGKHVAINRLSLHIARAHPRPAPTDMTPTLVPKPAVAKKRPGQ